MLGKLPLFQADLSCGLQTQIWYYRLWYLASVIGNFYIFAFHLATITHCSVTEVLFFIVVILQFYSLKTHVMILQLNKIVLLIKVKEIYIFLKSDMGHFALKNILSCLIAICVSLSKDKIWVQVAPWPYKLKKKRIGYKWK